MCTLLARSRALPPPAAAPAAAAAVRRQQRRWQSVRRSLPSLHLASLPDSTDQQQKQACGAEAGAPPAGGVLQLGQLATPAALRDAWQARLAPECAAAWQQLQQQLLRWQAAEAEQQAATAAVGAQPRRDDTPAQAQQQQWPRAFLHQLDALLGNLQQVGCTPCMVQGCHAMHAFEPPL